MSQMIKTELSRMSEKTPVLNNHRYVDKNIHETIERVQNYEIHQKKLFKIKEELEKKRLKKINADQSYEHLKSQMINNKLKSHEFTETEKINEIKKSNQILLEKLLDISKGKRCEVKQENLHLTLPQQKSLNYQVKKKEAERIDFENQKIMERIVNQNPSLSSKKMQQEYMDTIKYKKLKGGKTKGLDVEKILEKKRKMVNEARSTILPLLQTKQYSPNGHLTTEMTGRNFHMNPVESQSQRMSANNIQSQDESDAINIANTQTDYNKTGQVQTRYPSLNKNLNQSSNVTPSQSNRQNRQLARSELAEYRESKNSQGSQQPSKKPSKVILEAIKNPAVKSNTINMNNSMNYRQNKPPLINQTKTIPKGSENTNSLNHTSKIPKSKPNELLVAKQQVDKTIVNQRSEEVKDQIQQDQIQTESDQDQPVPLQQENQNTQPGYQFPDDDVESLGKKSNKSQGRVADEIQEQTIEEEYQSKPNIEKSPTIQEKNNEKLFSNDQPENYAKADVLSEQYEEDFVAQSKNNTQREMEEIQKQKTQQLSRDQTNMSKYQSNKKGDQSSLIQDSFLKEDTKFEERNSIVSGAGDEEDDEKEMDDKMDQIIKDYEQKQQELENELNKDDAENGQDEEGEEAVEQEYDEVFDEDDQ